MLTKLLNLLISFTIFLNPIKPLYDFSTTSLGKPFTLIDFDDYSYNSTYLFWNNGDETLVNYSYYDNSSLNYTYMVYPYNLSSDTYDVYSIFVDFPFFYDNDINDILIDNHIFELNLFYLDSIPFTNSSTTLNFFKSIDNMDFDYYLEYDSTLYNGLIENDVIHSYITFDNYINSESNLFIIMRFSRAYYDYIYNVDDVIESDHVFEGYLSNSNGFFPVTYCHNINILLSNLKLVGYDYNNGFTDGVNSVDTSYFYNNGFTAGVNSVNVNAIYQNGYTQGYNVGVTESSGSYGITDLLYSVFDIPVIMLSNLLSFTIFGQDAWGLILSILFLGVILYLIRLFINGHKLQ